MPDGRRTRTITSKAKAEDAFDPIDALAIVASMLWLGVMVSVGLLVSQASGFALLARALIGATVVYVIAFVGLHTMIRMARANVLKARKAQEQEPTPESAAPTSGSAVEAA